MERFWVLSMECRRRFLSHHLVLIVASLSLLLHYPVFGFNAWPPLVIFALAVYLILNLNSAPLARPDLYFSVILLGLFFLALAALFNGVALGAPDWHPGSKDAARYLLSLFVLWVIYSSAKTILANRVVPVLALMLLISPFVVGLEQALSVTMGMPGIISEYYREPMPVSRRISGTFQFPYSFALYLSWVVAGLFLYFLFAKGFGQRAIVLLILLISVFLFAMTGSRTGVILLFPLLATVPLWPAVSYLLTGFLVGVGIVVIVLSQGMVSDIGALQRFGGFSVDIGGDARMQYWIAHLFEWKNSPWLGSGVAGANLPPPHNSYIYVISNYGLLGLAPLLGMVSASVLLAVGHLKAGLSSIGRERRLVHAYFAYVVFTVPLYFMVSNGLNMPFVLIPLALAAAYLSSERGRRSSVARADIAGL